MNSASPSPGHKVHCRVPGAPFKPSFGLSGSENSDTRMSRSWDLKSTSPAYFEPSYNMAPQSFQPVVRLAPETGERELTVMRWG